MLNNYTVDWKNGKPATAFEYSQLLFWTDHTQNHKITYWEDEGKVVGLCWYDDQIGNVNFNLEPGYEEIISDMIDTAEDRLSKEDGSIQVNLYGGQEEIIKEIKRRGYQKTGEWKECIYDFSKNMLNRPLPEGFHFEDNAVCDKRKLIEATWKGFDNPEKPEEYFQEIEDNYQLDAAPHGTPELNVIIKSDSGEYACFAGAWMVPENHLVYMEPLCTVPKYRGKGLAAAALSELVRRTRHLGATHMTGGTIDFYYHIGYDPLITWISWKRP